ncbi:MAG: hypothetical protein DRN08_01675 [Thermoplasmata archaeon]|nr:MAG: hypothetical protein DRN05_01365 [Thermoplasmata archaeon]RLF36240.1 MAG: hypothetical protein DRN08_01675 [Thermoplasmata archaeon]
MKVVNRLMKPDIIEKRDYQINIYEEIKDRNSLVILPTGLGKTVIALLVLLYKLSQGKRVMFLAPTKPLCEQHASFIKKSTVLPENDVIVVTGEMFTPEKRGSIYGLGRVVVATPQTIANDISKRLRIDEFGLLIFDEAHRAIGNYAYVKIARHYLKTSSISQTLGLTASPGSDFEKLKEMAYNLGIEHIEIRTEDDPDVKPYLSNRLMRWHLLDMPSQIREITDKIDHVLKELLQNLSKYSAQAKNLMPNRLSKKALIEIQSRMKKNIGRRGGTLYHGLSLVSAAIKLAHLRDILTSQGIDVAKSYILKLENDRSSSTNRIKKHPLYVEIKRKLMDAHVCQPKLMLTKQIITDHLSNMDDPRIMIFAEYRDTVDMLVTELDKINGVKVTGFIGQKRNSFKNGMTQEEQKKILDEFRRGTYNVLVSTSIGEEGIDIPATSLVLFYEPVPTAIRHIQRKGRTARDGHIGMVRILIMRDSRDEAFYWSSINKEKMMYKQAYRLKKLLESDKNMLKSLVGRQSKIDEYL